MWVLYTTAGAGKKTGEAIDKKGHGSSDLHLPGAHATLTHRHETLKPGCVQSSFSMVSTRVVLSLRTGIYMMYLLSQGVVVVVKF